MSNHSSAQNVLDDVSMVIYCVVCLITWLVGVMMSVAGVQNVLSCEHKVVVPTG